MVPSDYRLDHVAARLIERLEGKRPTFADRPDDALRVFSETAENQIEAALGEMQGVGWTEDLEGHRAFLEREVLQTFLPRYHALSSQMSLDEARGFGFGWLAEPIGRLGLVVAALLIGWLVLLKLIFLPIVWPLVLLDVSLPFWPDIASAMYRRR